jgi:hypothetical protein
LVVNRRNHPGSDNCVLERRLLADGTARQQDETKHSTPKQRENVTAVHGNPHGSSGNMQRSIVDHSRLVTARENLAYRAAGSLSNICDVASSGR